jgi:hypothetical protein
MTVEREPVENSYWDEELQNNLSDLQVIYRIGTLTGAFTSNAVGHWKGPQTGDVQLRATPAMTPI